MSGWTWLGQHLYDAYNPQSKQSRWGYFKTLCVVVLLALSGYTLARALADWDAISDETILWIARYPEPLCVNALLCYVIAATARRLHDMGWSGAPALLLCLPEPWLVIVPLALLWPSASSEQLISDNKH